MANLKSAVRSLRFALLLHNRAPLAPAYHRKLSGRLQPLRWRVPTRTGLRLARWILITAFLLGHEAQAIDTPPPLAPLDTQSPKATLTAFLTTMDEALRLRRDDILNAGT